MITTISYFIIIFSWGTNIFSGGLINGIPRLNPLRIKISTNIIAKTGISLSIPCSSLALKNLPTNEVANIIGAVPNFRNYELGENCLCQLMRNRNQLHSLSNVSSLAKIVP